MAEQVVLRVAEAIEENLDKEIARLQRMDADDLDAIRERRLQQMKSRAEQTKLWRAQGHGEYTEVPDEKAFFAAVKNSVRVVCHFYRSATLRCQVIDRHMKILAQQHLETRFIKIDAERSPFLVERLRVWMLPTLALVKKGKVEDYIVGFDEFGGVDEFPTEALEFRLFKSEMIDHESSSLPKSSAGDDADDKKDKVRSIRQSTHNKGGNDSGDDLDSDSDWD